MIEENSDILEVLLAAGAPTEMIDNYDTTPLMEAVTYNKQKSVKLLLEYGASPTFHNSGALEIARDKGNTELEKLLESYMQ